MSQELYNFDGVCKVSLVIYHLKRFIDCWTLESDMTAFRLQEWKYW